MCQLHMQIELTVYETSYSMGLTHIPDSMQILVPSKSFVASKVHFADTHLQQEQHQNLQTLARWRTLPENASKKSLHSTHRLTHVCC
jgi:hypothetical protein